jgi:Bacterial protein of unknown function (DUF885)
MARMNPDRRRALQRGLAVLGTTLLGSSKGLAGENPTENPVAKDALAGDAKPAGAACGCDRAADGSALDTAFSELRPMIERYQADLRDMNRMYPLASSPARKAKLDAFFTGQTRLLEAVHFEALTPDGRVDYTLFLNHLQHQREQLKDDDRKEAELAPLVPYQAFVINFEEARRHMEPLDSQKAAATLTAALAEIKQATSSLPSPKPRPGLLARSANRINELRGTLRWWHDFYNLYDPEFAWWVDSSYKQVDAAMDQHLRALLTAAGIKLPPENAQPPEPSGFGGGRRFGGPEFTAPPESGDLAGAGPAGRDALVEALRYNMIAYTPEELIAIANKEFAWCDKEMLRASHEMGFGDDWKKAQEKVKNSYPAPGKMIYAVQDLQKEAMTFIDAHDLVTIPSMARQDWWEEALSPQAQLTSPFFLGGDVIMVSSPASSMTTRDRLETLRGNNTYFSRGTVFHELNPGHHLQGYMSQRYRVYRSPFHTAFWTEGMAFYWEMLMWDLGYDQTPEQRIGVLFWRMHRCARIIFSLNFHLGQWPASQCVDFLVDRVGHERANAEGEVRRSFDGSYEPIYQCAYMLGALQFYALHKEFVGAGKMPNRAFHDALYINGNMPIEMVRAAVGGAPPARNFQPTWKFYGPVSA